MSHALFWIAVYLLLALGPLLLLLAGGRPPGLGFWWDLSVALGFAGMAMMGVQFLLTARFKRASAPFGIDILYYFHRYLALLAFAFVVAHYFILRTGYPTALLPVNPADAPFYMTAGRISLALFAVVIVTSLWRKQLKLEYDFWRLTHGLIAAAAFLLALLHIDGSGYYLQQPVKRLAWNASALFWLLLLLYLRVIKPYLISRKPYNVLEVRKERGAVWTVVVEPAGATPPMQYEPGQFAWLTLRASPYQLREHPFSFSSTPTRGPRLEFTIKELGDFTRTIGTIQPGETAYIDAPFGVFSVDRYPHAPAFVFIAGGIGIAPMISMLRALADRGDKRPLTLVYGNECWDRVVFREELDELRERLNLEVVHVLGDPPEDWTGERGFISAKLLQRRLSPVALQGEFFLCGPNPMLRAVEKGLYEIGVPLTRSHSEIFDMV